MTTHNFYCFVSNKKSLLLFSFLRFLFFIQLLKNIYLFQKNSQKTYNKKEYLSTN